MVEVILICVFAVIAFVSTLAWANTILVLQDVQKSLDERTLQLEQEMRARDLKGIECGKYKRQIRDLARENEALRREVFKTSPAMSGFARRPKEQSQKNGVDEHIDLTRDLSDEEVRVLAHGIAQRKWESPVLLEACDG